LSLESPGTGVRNAPEYASGDAAQAEACGYRRGESEAFPSNRRMLLLFVETLPVSEDLSLKISLEKSLESVL
jgi:hypothetical protein